MAKEYVIGIDVGGTNTKFGIVDSKGTILEQGRIRTDAHENAEDFIEELYGELSLMIASHGGTQNFHGIGVGAPNGNYYTGTIEYAPNLKWKGIIPIAELMEKKFQLPTRLTNDANAAAVGEMKYGAAKGMKHLIEMLTENPSTTSLLRNYSIDDLTSETVFKCAEQGDTVANQIFEFTGQILGEALANFVMFSSPEAIVLFGGLTKAGDLILKPTVQAMEANLIQIFKNKVKIIYSELKEADAAILGASALVW